MTLSGGPCASLDGVTSVVADFDAVEEMNAEGPARLGKQADAGLAVKRYRVSCNWQLQKPVESIPRRAIEATDLVLESIVKVDMGDVPLERRCGY